MICKCVVGHRDLKYAMIRLSQNIANFLKVMLLESRKDGLKSQGLTGYRYIYELCTLCFSSKLKQSYSPRILVIRMLLHANRKLRLLRRPVYTKFQAIK